MAMRPPAPFFPHVKEQLRSPGRYLFFNNNRRFNSSVNLIESIKLAFSAIWANKLRSFLTLLGVIFGVATVIVVVSLIEGFNHYVDEKIADIGTNAFAVRKFSIDDFSSVEALNAARRRNKDIRLEDAEALRQRGGAIADVGATADTLGEVK